MAKSNVSQGEKNRVRRARKVGDRRSAKKAKHDAAGTRKR
jgi:hypothetical protein